ncbi:hypothetical protein Bca52824_022773 [Brassica carinata]|uniref:60S ribosomal protein L36 n=1 Tax=Brassica carinata TaxID=52824 RepID=A0A8X7VH77_BRACI|nr:hypothetical protein Bca52824_022773 [Brassica carinata]
MEYSRSFGIINLCCSIIFEQRTRCYKIRVGSASPKEKTSKTTLFIRSLIREEAGFAPYEKRTTGLLKVGKDKRVLLRLLIKRKLGTHKRTKSKREDMSIVLCKMRYARGATTDKKI